MKTKTNDTNKTDETETFLRIFDNVKHCKALDWIERAILSNHISFQKNGKEFYQTDAYQAKVLGLSPAQINKYTGRLKERELIDTKIVYETNPNGGRPIPVRYVTVIDMYKWITGDKVPAVKAIVSPTKKKQAKRIEELTKSKNEVATSTTIKDEVSVIQSVNQQEIKPSVKLKKTKKDKNLEEMLEEVESKEALVIKSNSNEVAEVITLDSEKDIDNTVSIGKSIIEKIKNNEEMVFKKVNIKFGEDCLPDEALKISSGKYFLKSTLKQMDGSIFE